jgi:hypothetical protein
VQELQEKERAYAMQEMVMAQQNAERARGQVQQAQQAVQEHEEHRRVMSAKAAAAFEDSRRLHRQEHENQLGLVQQQLQQREQELQRVQKAWLADQLELQKASAQVEITHR